MPAPRTLRISARAAPADRGPETGRVRPRCVPASCSSWRIENAVTDLPLPDSPTSPSVSPLRISNDTSSTATTGRPGTSNTVVRLLNRAAPASLHCTCHPIAPARTCRTACTSHRRATSFVYSSQTLRAAYQRFRRPLPSASTAATMGGTRLSLDRAAAADRGERAVPA